MVCQVPPELTWGNPGSHLVLRALDGAWSWSTAWWPQWLQNWSHPQPRGCYKNKSLKLYIPASIWDMVSAMLSYLEMISSPLVGHTTLVSSAVSALPLC